MAVNKVIYDGNTLIDLTGDTATEDMVMSGATFHLANGTIGTGTLIDGDDIGYGVNNTAPIVGLGTVGSMVLGNQDSSLVGTGQVGSMTI